MVLDPLSLQCLIHPCLLCFACAGVIKEVVDTHKLREKLAMLVTDNAANMVLARRLVVESDGFKHILQMRWVGGLHALHLGLVVCMLLGVLFPLHVTCDTLAIRYWHHLKNTPTDRLLHKIHTAWDGKFHPWGRNMQRLLTQYNIDTSNPTEVTKENFKGHVEARAINYLRAYWTQPPRNLGGSVHTRYMADFGIGELTPRRPKIRTYLRTQTIYPRLDDCRAAELFMHFRLETLSLHAFHSGSSTSFR